MKLGLEEPRERNNEEQRLDLKLKLKADEQRSQVSGPVIRSISPESAGSMEEKIYEKEKF